LTPSGKRASVVKLKPLARELSEYLLEPPAVELLRISAASAATNTYLVI